ncbi:flavin mononucleotide phosphatase [bacterium endosymbiont of Pedicinus badii]|nr:flavin mononucleotide phosphatase [bacterium endosymbiont of Pedicinus badii]
MRIYKNLINVRAITFDLDNTLYDDKPIVKKADYESMKFLKDYHPKLKKIKKKEYQKLREFLRNKYPHYFHDVNYWRWFSIYLVMKNVGISEKQAKNGANIAMKIVQYWRSRIHIPKQTHEILKKLKNSFPLIIITNGNANPYLFGIGKYFFCILRAGIDGRSKPYKDMYKLASLKLCLPINSILHVGDDIITDIKGAIDSGMQACWINKNKAKNFKNLKRERILPHLEISNLHSLLDILEEK